MSNDVERVSNQAIFDALATLLDEERSWTKDQLASLNGNELHKSACMMLVEAKLKALRTRYANIGIRTSKAVDGVPPAALAKLWSDT